MTYLINDTSNLYKTKVTVRTHTPVVTKFLSTANEAKIAIVSNSSNIEPVMYYDWSQGGTPMTSNITYSSKADNIFYLGTTTLNNEIYVAVDQKQAIHKIATFRTNTINLNADTTVYGNLLPSSNIYSLGNPDQKWRNLSLSGCNLYFGEAIIQYVPNSNELAFKHNNIITTPSSNLETVTSNILTTSNITLDDGSIITMTSNYTVSSNVWMPTNIITSNIEYVSVTAKHLSVYSDDGSRAILSTSEYGTTLVSYSPEADVISSLNLTSLNTDQIAEHPNNLYFTFERARAVIEANATESASSVSGTSNEFVLLARSLSDSFQADINTNTSNLSEDVANFGSNINSNLQRDYTNAIKNIDNTSNTLNQNINTTLATFNPRIYEIDSNASNYLRTACNQILDTLQHTSNNLITQLNATNISLSNLIATTSNDITTYRLSTSNTLATLITTNDTTVRQNITLTSNTINQFWIDTSNQIAQSITYAETNMLSYISTSSNSLIESITLTSNTLADDVSSNYLAIDKHLSDTSNELIESIQTLHSAITDKIDKLTLDDIANGATNKFIVNNIYDRDLTVSNLTVEGHVLPSVSETFSIGSSDQRWRDLWLSKSTIHLADVQISATDNQGIEIKNNAGDLVDIVVSKVLIKDAQTDGYTVLQSVDNAISIGAATADNTEVSESVEKVVFTTSVSEGSNQFFTFARAGAIAAASNQLVIEYTTQTSNEISNRINVLTTDEIANGTSNRFIVNGVYDGDLTIYATLTVSNLDIKGSTASIQTNEYITEMLKIDTEATDGPALKVVNTAINSNIAEFYYDTIPVLIIDSSGGVAVGKTVADEKLDIIGNIKLGGNINGVTAVELSYLSGVTSPVQPQLDSINVDNSNLTSNLNVRFTAAYIDTSNQLSTTINDLNNNFAKYIDASSNSFGSNVLTTSNNILSYTLQLNDVHTSNLLSMSNIFNAGIPDVSDKINQRLDILQTNLNSYITNTCNTLLQNVATTSNTIRSRIQGIQSTGWQATGSNIIFLNKVSIGSNSFGSETLRVFGNIKFSGSINEVSSNEFNYLNGVTSPIQTQLTDTSNNLVRYTNSTSNFFIGLFSSTSNSISSLMTRVNSNIFGYVTTTSNEFMTNVRTTSNNLSGSLNTFLSRGYVASQWSNVGQDIYYTIGNVGIGTSSVGNNELEVYGDINIVGDYNLKKTLEGIADVPLQNSIWYQFNQEPLFNNGILYDSNTTTSSTKYDMSINGNFYVKFPKYQLRSSDITKVKTSSAEFSSPSGFLAFSGSTYFQYWGSEDSPASYDTSTGLANFTANYFNNHTTFYGEWIVIDLLETVQLAKYRIYPVNDKTNAAPKKFRLYATNNVVSFGSGSDDPNTKSSDWVQLDERTNITYTNNNYNEFSISPSQTFRYYAIIINEIGGNSTNVQISEIEFFSLSLTKIVGYTSSYLYTNAYLWCGDSQSSADDAYLTYTGDVNNIRSLLNAFHTSAAFSVHFVFKTAYNTYYGITYTS